MIERLREERVRGVIEPILTGERPEDEVFNDDLLFVEDLGLIAPGGGLLEIANPIYREIIPRALTAADERSSRSAARATSPRMDASGGTNCWTALRPLAR